MNVIRNLELINNSSYLILITTGVYNHNKNGSDNRKKSMSKTMYKLNIFQPKCLTAKHGRSYNKKR